MKPLELKAYKFINSQVARRSPSEYRFLCEQFKIQKAKWEIEIEQNKPTNPFDINNTKNKEQNRYLKYLIQFGIAEFKKLNVW